MKKLLLILTMSLGLVITTNAQTIPYVQVGVSAGFDKVVNENLEIGVQSGHNRFGLIGQSFDSVKIHRKYLVGAKYTRIVNILPNLDGTISLAGKTRTDNVSTITIEPGVGFDFTVVKGLSFVAGITLPITQTSFKAHTTTFAGGVGLKLDL